MALARTVAPPIVAVFRTTAALLGVAGAGPPACAAAAPSNVRASADTPAAAAAAAGTLGCSLASGSRGPACMAV